MDKWIQKIQDIEEVLEKLSKSGRLTQEIWDKQMDKINTIKSIINDASGKKGNYNYKQKPSPT